MQTTQTTSFDYKATRISQIIDGIQSARSFIRILTSENDRLDDSQQACLEVTARQLQDMELEYAELTGTTPVHHTAIVPRLKNISGGNWKILVSPLDTPGTDCKILVSDK